MTEIEALKELNAKVTDKPKDKALRIVLRMAWNQLRESKSMKEAVSLATELDDIK